MSETLTAATLCGGLNPDQSQQVYRAMLDAFARPGLPVSLPDTAFPAALLPMLALADLETSAHLLGAEDWAAVVAVATGAPITALGDARLVTSLRCPTELELGSVTAGMALRPESGATVVCAVEALTGGEVVRLTGPGVRHVVECAPIGFDTALWSVRGRLVSGFPAGIDLLLVAPDGAAVGIPRTTVIEIERDN
ncbi:phosphonate C-P lyase system protein PhnH [Rhodococcus sp. NPDC058532]|uniref:phosphonate C-P lyase system protein PhnH n=1 Tax=Rhodococcus sp. NPDC058532 TaxID=3346540 RepID=UPI00364E5F27